MFERYSERAREVMPYANWHAHFRGANAIEADDIIAGILILGEGVAVEVLRQLNISIADLRSRLGVTLEIANFVPVSNRLPLHHSSNVVINQAIRFCKKQRHDGVGTEHILVGWLETESESAQGLLSDKSICVDDVKRSVISYLAGSRDTKPGFIQRLLGRT